MLKHLVRKDSGSALVELALTVPVLLFIMIGAAELGRMAYYAIEVQNAARAAVAYGSRGETSAADTAGMTTAADNEAPNMGNLNVTATQSCVCQSINASTGAVSDGSQQSAATCAGGAASSAANCTAAAPSYPNLVNYVNVTTTATVHTMFNYSWLGLGLPSTYTLNGYAQMRVLTTG